MMKVLVVGANSYIGIKFKEYVENNHIENMIVEMVSASDGSWENVDFTKYDTVIHLAAIVHRKEKKKLEPLYYKVNHQLAVNVAKRAKESKVKQFIFMSTAAVYGGKINCITIETRPNPDTFYGKSKLKAEEDIKKLEDNIFKVVIIRPPMVYGDGCRGNYAKLKQMSRFAFIFPEIHNRRSFLDVNKLTLFLCEIINGNRKGLFLPKDDYYTDICVLVAKFRGEMGKKTYLTSYFNIILKYLIKRVKLVNKIFGDLYYS